MFRSSHRSSFPKRRLIPRGSASAVAELRRGDADRYRVIRTIMRVWRVCAVPPPRRSRESYYGVRGVPGYDSMYNIHASPSGARRRDRCSTRKHAHRVSRDRPPCGPYALVVCRPTWFQHYDCLSNVGARAGSSWSSLYTLTTEYHPSATRRPPVERRRQDGRRSHLAEELAEETERLGPLLLAPAKLGHYDFDELGHEIIVIERDALLVRLQREEGVLTNFAAYE